MHTSLLYFALFAVLLSLASSCLLALTTPWDCSTNTFTSITGVEPGIDLFGTACDSSALLLQDVRLTDWLRISITGNNRIRSLRLRNVFLDVPYTTRAFAVYVADALHVEESVIFENCTFVGMSHAVYAMSFVNISESFLFVDSTVDHKTATATSALYFSDSMSVGNIFNVSNNIHVVNATSCKMLAVPAVITARTLIVSHNRLHYSSPSAIMGSVITAYTNSRLNLPSLVIVDNTLHFFGQHQNDGFRILALSQLRFDNGTVDIIIARNTVHCTTPAYFSTVLGVDPILRASSFNTRAMSSPLARIAMDDNTLNLNVGEGADAFAHFRNSVEGVELHITGNTVSLTSLGGPTNPNPYLHGCYFREPTSHILVSLSDHNEMRVPSTVYNVTASVIHFADTTHNVSCVVLGALLDVHAANSVAANLVYFERDVQGISSIIISDSKALVTVASPAATSSVRLLDVGPSGALFNASVINISNSEAQLTFACSNSSASAGAQKLEASLAVVSLMSPATAVSLTNSTVALSATAASASCDPAADFNASEMLEIHLLKVVNAASPPSSSSSFFRAVHLDSNVFNVSLQRDSSALSGFTCPPHRCSLLHLDNSAVQNLGGDIDFNFTGNIVVSTGSSIPALLSMPNSSSSFAVLGAGTAPPRFAFSENRLVSGALQFIGLEEPGATPPFSVGPSRFDFLCNFWTRSFDALLPQSVLAPTEVYRYCVPTESKSRTASVSTAPKCDVYTNEADCLDNPRCRWHEVTPAGQGYCYAACHLHEDQAPCDFDKQCEWDWITSTCIPRMCKATDSGQCVNITEETCRWLSNETQINVLSYTGYNNLTVVNMSDYAACKIHKYKQFIPGIAGELNVIFVVFPCDTTKLCPNFADIVDAVKYNTRQCGCPYLHYGVGNDVLWPNFPRSFYGEHQKGWMVPADATLSIYVQDQTSLKVDGVIMFETECYGACKKTCDLYPSESTCTNPLYTTSCSWDPLGEACRSQCITIEDNVTCDADPLCEYDQLQFTCATKCEYMLSKDVCTQEGLCFWFRDGKCRRKCAARASTEEECKLQEADCMFDKLLNRCIENCPMGFWPAESAACDLNYMCFFWQGECLMDCAFRKPGFSEEACAADPTCRFDYYQHLCLPDCWRFEQSDCKATDNAQMCSWNSTTVPNFQNCTRRCSHMRGHNISANCTANPQCRFDTGVRDDCYRKCFIIWNASECLGNPTCKWQNQTCKPMCRLHDNQPHCAADPECQWHAGDGVCFSIYTTTSTTTTTTSTTTTTTSTTVTSSTTSSNMTTTAATTTSAVATTFPPTTRPPRRTATRTPTRERTSEIPPKPVKSKPPVVIPTSTTALSTTTTILGVIAGIPSVGSLTIRAGLMATGASCGEEPEPVDFFSNPTQLTTDDLGLYRWWGGTVCGNAILCASFAAVVVSAVYLYRALCDKKADRQLTVGIGMACTMWIILSQPAVVGFVAASAYSDIKTSSVFAGVVCIGVVTILTTVVYPLWIFRRVHDEQPLEHCDSEALPDDAGLLKRITEYLFGSFKNLDWGDSSTDLRLRWGFLFEHTSSLWFAAMEIVCGFAINVVVGTMQDANSTPAQCRLRAIVALVMHLPPTLFVLIKWPLLTRFDTFLSPTLWSLNALMALLVVCKLFGVDNGGIATWGLGVTLSLIGAVGMIASLGLVYSTYDVVSRALERKQQANQQQRDQNLRDAFGDTGLLIGGGGASIDNNNDDNNELEMELLGATAGAGGSSKQNQDALSDVVTPRETPGAGGSLQPSAADQQDDLDELDSLVADVKKKKQNNTRNS